MHKSIKWITKNNDLIRISIFSKSRSFLLSTIYRHAFRLLWNHDRFTDLTSFWYALWHLRNHDQWLFKNQLINLFVRKNSPFYLFHSFATLFHHRTFFLQFAYISEKTKRNDEKIENYFDRIYFRNGTNFLPYQSTKEKMKRTRFQK